MAFIITTDQHVAEETTDIGQKPYALNQFHLPS